MKKLLAIASGAYFLGWLKKVPWKVKLWDLDWANMTILDKGFFYLTFRPKLNLISRRYDFVFCDWFDKVAALTSQASSKPIYVRAHRCEADVPIWFKVADMDNIKAIITVSHAYKKYVNDIIGDSVPIYVVPNGVDMEKFSFNAHIHDPLKVCTVSNLTPRKRIFDLIINNPELEIDIGGSGAEHRTLEYAIRKFKLKAKLFGWVSLPKFYHQHDIFIMNSSDESFGVSLVEAMSCGLIPLCFAWNGIEEILPPDHIYENYEELQDKLQKINQMSHTEINELKRKMRQIVESKFTLERQAKSFMAIFEKGFTELDLARKEYDPRQYWERRGKEYHLGAFNGSYFNEHEELVKSFVNNRGLKLEIGCGFGRLLQFSDAIGMDFSLSMLRKANTRVQNELVCASATHIPFRDNVFETVYTCEALMHVPYGQIEAVRNEIIRVGSSRIIHIEYFEKSPPTLSEHCFNHNHVSAYENMGLKIEKDETLKTTRKQRLTVVTK